MIQYISQGASCNDSEVVHASRVAFTSGRGSDQNHNHSSHIYNQAKAIS